MRDLERNPSPLDVQSKPGTRHNRNAASFAHRERFPLRERSAKRRMYHDQPTPTRNSTKSRRNQDRPHITLGPEDTAGLLHNDVVYLGASYICTVLPCLSSPRPQLPTTPTHNQSHDVAHWLRNERTKQHREKFQVCSSCPTDEAKSDVWARSELPTMLTKRRLLPKRTFCANIHIIQSRFSEHIMTTKTA